MRVLIVDDHPLYRQGLRVLLQAIDPAARVADADSVADAERLGENGEDFDLVLLDMHLPGPSGLDALARVRAAFESAAVVVVSADEDPALVRATIDAGAAGYVPKTTDPQLAVQALRLVLAHGTYLPPQVIRHLDDETLRDTEAPPRPAQPPRLSERQRAVLRALLQGKSNKVIARELDIAEGTVKAHLWAVYQALGVTSRLQAMARVHEWGLSSLLG